MTNEQHTEPKPFDTRPICWPPTGGLRGPLAAPPHYTATRTYLYIRREPGEDCFGPHPQTYLHRNDLVASGRVQPAGGGLPADANIWQRADRAAASEGEGGISAISAVATLPPGASLEDWQALIEIWAEAELLSRGMICDWAVHAPRGSRGFPHAHLLITARGWSDPDGCCPYRSDWLSLFMRAGELEASWLAVSELAAAL